MNAVQMNSMVNNWNVSMNVICNPMEKNEVCMKMPTAQQVTISPT